MSRIRLGVVYGGRSSEHEVSLQSARCVIENLDRDRFEIVPIAIDTEGRWHVEALPESSGAIGKSLPVHPDAPSVNITTRPSAEILQGDAAPAVDVLMPMMHGPLCEDGSIQGLFEMADVPYVGAGVLGSAVCMDKDVAKRLVRAEGIPTTDYVALHHARWRSEWDDAALTCPVFVKPANMGSSVGVRRVDEASELEDAVLDALRYDTKVLVERAVNAREFEVAVLAAEDPAAPPEVSLAGEIEAVEGFYSFDRKYVEADGATLRIPAEVDPETMSALRDVARRAYLALCCEPMARIDLFQDRQTGRILFNEANTIPGFTTISMYPKLWEASGLPYPQLLSRLVDHALARHALRSTLKRDR